MERIIKFIIISLCFIPIYINADVCSEAKNDADKITYSYKVIYDVLDDAYFKVELKNLTDKLYIEDEYGKELKKNTFKVFRNSEPQEVEVPIYDKNLTCEEPVKILKINLPTYNRLSKDKICQGIEDYKYCKETLEENISEEQLRSNINSFKKSLKDKGLLKEEIKEEKSRSTIIIILINIALILAIFIILKLKRSKEKGHEK